MCDGAAPNTADLRVIVSMGGKYQKALRGSDVCISRVISIATRYSLIMLMI